MSDLMRVKPVKEGAVVRFPENPARLLSSEGELVPRNKFWTRRLDGGDVVMVPEPKAEPEKKAVKDNK